MVVVSGLPCPPRHQRERARAPTTPATVCPTGASKPPPRPPAQAFYHRTAGSSAPSSTPNPQPHPHLLPRQAVFWLYGVPEVVACAFWWPGWVFACWCQWFRAYGRVWAWCPCERTSAAKSQRLGRLYTGWSGGRRTQAQSERRPACATERTAAPTGPGGRRVIGRAFPARWCEARSAVRGGACRLGEWSDCAG